MSYRSAGASVFLEALEALPDVAWCEGELAIAAPIELAIPGGTRALDAPDLAAWLLAHSEPAPFGDASGTHVDHTVRDTRRMTARSATTIAHFDPSAIAEAIERALGADCRIAIDLLDVLVYTPGSRFVKHKDTPRSDDQLGTLVVELPHAHRGGVLHLVDGDRAASVDWSCVQAAPDVVRWVAMFGDVDHEIAPVTDGMRITAVYTLRYLAAERLPSPHRERIDTISDAAIGLYEEWDDQLLAIPCSRMIVAPRDATFPLSHHVLRGSDRLIAAALERAGIGVIVRACVIVASRSTTPVVEAFEDAESYRRAVLLRSTIPEALIDAATGISWDPTASGHEAVIAMIAPYVDAEAFPDRCTWLVRQSTQLPGKAMSWSHTGYFGNEHSEHYVYRFAMMLAHVPSQWELAERGGQ